MSWNFALILFVLLVLTGAIWVLDLAVLRRGRESRAQAAMAQYDVAVIGDAQEAERLRREAGEEARRMPWWIEYAVSFFPVILFVFMLRSFVVEPFRIPSGSMLPTLQSGDLILVNKFSYGLRLPVLDKKVVDIGSRSAATCSCSVIRWIRTWTTSSAWSACRATRSLIWTRSCTSMANWWRMCGTATISSLTVSLISHNTKRNWATLSTKSCSMRENAGTRAAVSVSQPRELPIQPQWSTLQSTRGAVFRHGR